MGMITADNMIEYLEKTKAKPASTMQEWHLGPLFREHRKREKMGRIDPNHQWIFSREDMAMMRVNQTLLTWLLCEDGTRWQWAYKGGKEEE